MAATAHAQAQPPTADAGATADTPTLSASWLDAVDRYAAGEYVAAVMQLSTVDPDLLVSQGRRDADRWRAEATPDAQRRLHAVAGLAFELGLLHLDGSRERQLARYMELGEVAVRAADRATTADDPYGAIWRLAQLQLQLLGGQTMDIAARVRRDDLKLLPAALQAEWHMVQGIGYETAARLTLGTGRVQQTPFGTSSVPREVWVERNRHRALEHYEAAHAADRSHQETRLRLGRVLLELGRADKARPHLEAAATERCVQAICGLAWLTLGEWHLRHGSAEAARRAYVRASSVLEVRQSALLGLLAATLQARPAAAIELTRQFDASAMLGRQTGPDGWSRYVAGHPFGLTEVVGVMRKAATR